MSAINSQAQPKENQGVPQGETPIKAPGETEVCVIGAGIVGVEVEIQVLGGGRLGAEQTGQEHR